MNRRIRHSAHWFKHPGEAHHWASVATVCIRIPDPSVSIHRLYDDAELVRHSWSPWYTDAEGVLWIPVSRAATGLCFIHTLPGMLTQDVVDVL